jgi:hypothetical protein
MPLMNENPFQTPIFKKHVPIAILETAWLISAPMANVDIFGILHTSANLCLINLSSAGSRVLIISRGIFILFTSLDNR